MSAAVDVSKVANPTFICSGCRLSPKSLSPDFERFRVNEIASLCFLQAHPLAQNTEPSCEMLPEPSSLSTATLFTQ
jgi:hypothetical protein